MANHVEALKKARLESSLSHAVGGYDNLAESYMELHKFVEDLKTYGLRFDLNPTHMIGQNSEEFWHKYIRRADDSIRDRATEALRKK